MCCCRVLMERMDYLENLEKLVHLYVLIFFMIHYLNFEIKMFFLYHCYHWKTCLWFFCEGKSWTERSCWRTGTAWAQSKLCDHIFMFFIVCLCCSLALEHDSLSSQGPPGVWDGKELVRIWVTFLVAFPHICVFLNEIN